MGGYIFAGLVIGASWLFILSPFLILAYGVFTLVREHKQKAPKVTPAVQLMREARQMIDFARQYRAMGCEKAAKEAVRSALHFRKSAHACWHYGE